MNIVREIKYCNDGKFSNSIGQRYDIYTYEFSTREDARKYVSGVYDILNSLIDSFGSKFNSSACRKIYVDADKEDELFEQGIDIYCDQFDKDLIHAYFDSDDISMEWVIDREFIN